MPAIDNPTYTSKQMGDACEMLVAAEMTLANVPALKVPDNWPGYDVIAQPHDKELQKISVKSRTYKTGAAFFVYSIKDEFDWLALVVLPAKSGGERRIFIIPRITADKEARKNGPETKSANKRYFSISEVPLLFKEFENNFSLSVADSGKGSKRTVKRKT